MGQGRPNRRPYSVVDRTAISFLNGLKRAQVSAIAKISERLSNWISRKMVGGRDRDRTGDPLLAKQVLSQLSYTPTDLAR